MDKPAPKAIRRLDYSPTPHLIDNVDLDFQLGEESTLVRSVLRVRSNPAAPVPGPLVLDGQGMRLVSLSIDGRPLPDDAYTVDDDHLTIAQVPPDFALEVVTEIKPQDNTALEGLYKSSGNFCTQCEAEGFRKITYFIDRPDVMARFATTIEADEARYPVLLSNGNPVASGKLENGRHWVRWEDPFPKPSYLFALVAGTLTKVEDVFVTRSGRQVSLGIYVEPGNEDGCEHAMRSLKKAMAWDEERFGLEYDLELFNIVAVSDFNMGAMENKGLNIFNTRYVLAKTETATDADFLYVEAVIAHEYFHNWTGNRVTCRDWFQLSLKEGLTVYRDQEFTAEMHSRPVRRIADVQRLRAAQFVEDSGPLAHPVRPDAYIEINNFYTPTVYEKGAEVVRMIATLLGRDGFRRGMDLYFQRHDGEAVTCDDFVAAMADANGYDLAQFKLWYQQAGTPEIAVRSSYDPVACRYALTLTQTIPPTPGQPVKQPMHIPVAVGLLGSDGRDLPLRLADDPPGAPEAGAATRVLELKGAEQTFEFTNVPEEPVPSLLRGFSAPVRLKTSMDDERLAFLMAHDSDGFNRWEAGQMLGTRLLLGLIEDCQAGRPLHLPDRYVAAARHLIESAPADPAFAAQALALPSESYLAQQMAVVDVDAIHAARQFARRSLGATLREAWNAAYRRHDDGATVSLETAAIGRRALKNLALGYIMAAEDKDAVALCIAQYRQAATMTDTLAALASLANAETAERDRALADFYQKWQNDALVVNKWLSLQATTHRPDVLPTVRSLLDHPAFDIRNPNKVYALIGAFGGANQVRFHDASGAGYRFLADQVLRLDALNPQVAARMAGPFSRWRRFDSRRQALMRDELERIAGTAGLSPDVYEIVTKSLEARA